MKKLREKKNRQRERQLIKPKFQLKNKQLKQHSRKHWQKHLRNNKQPLKLSKQHRKKRDSKNKKKKKKKKPVNLLRKWLPRLPLRNLERRLKKRD